MTIIHTPWSLAPDNAQNNEHAIQTAFICWVRKAHLFGFELASREASYLTMPPEHLHQPVPDLGLLFAVPNGGIRGKVVAQRLNLEGVRAGVCDVIFPTPGKLGYMLALEFKQPNKKRNVTREQKDFMAGIQRHGGTAVVVTAWREAAFCILSHLGADPRWMP